MAVSGKCYLSLHSHFASANRGACVQNCRRNYIVTDKEDGIEFEIDNEYIMSAKDLCTIGFIDQILDAGVIVLKIEGRGRAADYVHTVTKCYREAIDSYYDGTYTQESGSLDETARKPFSIVAFGTAITFGKKMGEWHDENGSKSTKRKIYVAKGSHLY